MTEPVARKTNPVKLLLLLGIAGVLVWAVFGHHWRLNDQRYMLWSWTHLPSASVYGIAAACGVPFFLGQWLDARRPGARWPALALLCTSTFALMIAFRMVEFPVHDFSAIGWAVNNASNGGYLTEGVRFHNSGWSIAKILTDYPVILPFAMGHAYNKPPGLGLVCLWLVNQFGLGSATPTIVGLITAGMAALSVPACYLFIAHFTQDRDAAFCGAGFLALCPSLVLIYPTSDQIFPPVTVLLVLLWSMAMRTDRVIFSLLFGFSLAGTFFFAYIPAVLIVFLAGITFLKIRPGNNPRLGRIAWHAAAALIVLAAFYVALWLATGFNAIVTFKAAWHTEHIKMSQWCASTGFPLRTLPGTIPWDLYSFAMGTGWIGCLLAIYYFLPGRHAKSAWQFKLCLLCLAQILVVDLTGILPGETIRYWMFMLPLLMIPVGLELSRWGMRGRICAYAALLVLSGVLCQSMIFIV